MADEVQVAVGDDGVARLTINRPEKRNAMTWDVVAELRRRLGELAVDPRARVVVLTGAGDKAFCAGADLGTMGGEGTYALHQARGELVGLFTDLWELGKPTIARVRGYALAGGFGLALACDLVVASHDAVFGAPEMNVGLWPYMVTVPMLRSMPAKKALELMMTARQVKADEADRIGFVTRVVPADELDEAVDELAADLTNKSAAIMKTGRDSFYAVLDQSADDALALLHPLLALTNEFEDAKEGRAAFADKRDPIWRDR
jgi:enoyl-CoA hydratase/carnithine racemase